VIGYVPAGVGVWRFTVAGPDLLVSAADVAVTVTGELGLGNAGGAVYRPLASIEPLPVPVTAQVTFWFVELLTVALNC
jgi:hypothetical protein